MDVALSKARSKVAIIVTHMDMIPASSQHKFKNELKTALQKQQISSNYVYFGEKECEWDEKDLQKKEAEVKQFLQSVPEGEDYFEHLKTQSLCNANFLHIDAFLCKKKGCQHQFTDKTKEQYFIAMQKFQLLGM